MKALQEHLNKRMLLYVPLVIGVGLAQFANPHASGQHGTKCEMNVALKIQKEIFYGSITHPQPACRA